VVKNRIQKNKNLKAVDFFCCSGGVTCGFRQAGINVLGGIDIDGAYKDTYEKNNKGSKFIEADIAQLQPEELIKRLSILPNMDDLIFVGCSPCQYYTNLQTDKTKSSTSKLLLEEFQRFVDYFRPGFIFIENVPGLERNEESPLSKFKAFLRERSYSFDDRVVNAAEYDVPQNRKRYVLIASRVTKNISVPKGDKNKRKTVRDAIGNFEKVPVGYNDKSESMHWTANIQPINLLRIKNTSHDGGNRLEWKDNPALQLKCYQGKDSTFSDVYGRMFWDQPSPTITTKFHSITNGRFGHPEQDRALSIREGATLQSFPNNYKFYAESIGVVAKMIGNAVPPELARKIALSIVKTQDLNDC
jgi:DNA (cytosine-5)-methyltransferase 1